MSQSPLSPSISRLKYFFRTLLCITLLTQSGYTTQASTTMKSFFVILSSLALYNQGQDVNGAVNPLLNNTGDSFNAIESSPSNDIQTLINSTSFTDEFYHGDNSTCNATQLLAPFQLEINENKKTINALQQKIDLSSQTISDQTIMIQKLQDQDVAKDATIKQQEKTIHELENATKQINTNNDTIKALQEYIKLSNQTLNYQTIIIENLQEKEIQKDATINKQKQTINALENENKQINAKLNTTDIPQQACKPLNQTLTNQTITIQNLQKQETAKDATINKLKDKLKEQKKIARRLNQTITTQQGKITKLESQRATYRDLQNEKDRIQKERNECQAHKYDLYLAFPVWAILVIAGAYFYPSAFEACKKNKQTAMGDDEEEDSDEEEEENSDGEDMPQTNSGIITNAGFIA